MPATVKRDPDTPVRALVIGPYEQEFADVGTPGVGLPSQDVRALAFDSKGRLWAGTGAGAAVLEGGKWRAARQVTAAVNCLIARGDQMLAGSAEGVHIISASGGAKTLSAPGRWGAVYGLASDGRGRFYAALDQGMWIIEGDKLEAIEFPPTDHARSIAVIAGDAWLATQFGLLLWRDSKWTVLTKQNSGLVCDTVRALAADSQGVLWVATSEGVSLMDARGWGEKITGQNGLPYDDLTCVTVGPDGSRWFGSAIGANRLKGGHWRYYLGRRWLAGDKVQAIVVEKDGTAWIGTDAGLSRIYTRKMTLEKKCAVYEEIIAARHNRRGYVSGCNLQKPGDLSSYMFEATDNDGLWTSIYVGAECFRHAVTRSAEAKRLARQSVYAMMDLVNKSTVKGFPARAHVYNGERVTKSGGEWHPDIDNKGEWKGDTSSDELDGHYFAYSVYYDLVATEKEKEDLRRIVRLITDHLIEHGYYLVDVDGKPTTWGVFAPEMLHGPWEAQRGLNSLEMLSHLKVAYHMTGDAKYQKEYLKLAREHHYALNMIYQKITAVGHVNHSDDELAFLSYYPLVLYETDPELRAIYLLSFERSWQIEKPERNPLWNFIYGGLTGKPCQAEDAAATLQQIPTDQICWRVRNSHRKDLPHDPAYDRFRQPQALVALRADERPVALWNSNPYELDGGGDGDHEEVPSYYLLPYWMGRYFAIIAEGK